MSAHKNVADTERTLRRVLGSVRLELSEQDYLSALDALDELLVRARVASATDQRTKIPT